MSKAKAVMLKAQRREREVTLRLMAYKELAVESTLNTNEVVFDGSNLSETYIGTGEITTVPLETILYLRMSRA